MSLEEENCFLGTGILGAILKAAGYENLEALDGSEKMLKIAEERKLYKKVSAVLTAIAHRFKVSYRKIL